MREAAMKRIMCCFVVLFSIIVADRAVAQIPRVMNYQGVLLGSNAQPVPEGKYDLTFKIYDGTPNLLWTEVQPQVPVSGGLFNVLLGSVVPLNLAFEMPYVLGIQVGADPEMQPRTPLTSTAYSFTAGQVAGINNVFPSSGSVGIGTANPQQKLHVGGIGRFDVGPDLSHIDISTPGGWPGLIAFTPLGHRRDIIFDDPDPGNGYKGGLEISASPTSAAPLSGSGITITEEGNVGVGTSIPASKLDINFGAMGSVRAGTPSGRGAGWIFISPDGHRRDIVGDVDGLYIGAGAGTGGTTPALLVSESGNVGIGNTGVPTNILTISQTSATDPIADAWTTYSSRRWKTNIETIEDAIEKVKRLRGVSYDRAANGKREIGVIAEEVGEVIPEVVAFEKNGTDAQSVDYGRLVAVLIEAVKAQQREIDGLKARMEERRSAATAE
jgi:hypothetical protein